MKKKLKEGRFKASGQGQGELVAPVFDQQPPSGGGGGVAPSPESQWSLDPKYKIQPTPPRKFKGPQGGLEFVPPDLNQGGGGGVADGGGTGGGGKNVPYPDLPSVKPCDKYIFKQGYVRCPNYDLENGCGGKNVQDLQAQLVRKGFDLPIWKVDCKFSDETEEAVKEFQVSSGLPNTGVVDQRTYSRLFASQPMPSGGQPAGEVKKVRKFQRVQENLNKNYMLDRYQQIEDLVFERLVKNAN